jgi:hypothetical protein
MKLLESIIRFVMLTTKQHTIDESHGIIHSFNTLHNAHNIFQAERFKHPEMIPHEQVIYISSAIHDMCDKKYMDETENLQKIENFLTPHISKGETNAIYDIINTMSYSKVKKKGFPDLGKYQTAYHVVREADLLAAYDFDRAIIYNLYNKHNDIEGAYDESVELFNKRVLMHEEDNLFTFDYTKQNSIYLKQQSLIRIKQWKNIIKTFK